MVFIANYTANLEYSGRFLSSLICRATTPCSNCVAIGSVQSHSRSANSDGNHLSTLTNPFTGAARPPAVVADCTMCIASTQSNCPAVIGARRVAVGAPVIAVAVPSSESRVKVDRI